MGYWILEDKVPRETDDLVEWAEFMNEPERRQVAEDYVGKLQEIRVSTIFLGLDYGWSALGGPHQLFETMVFGGEFDLGRTQAATWEDALAMHAEVLAVVSGLAAADPDP